MRIDPATLKITVIKKRTGTREVVSIDWFGEHFVTRPDGHTWFDFEMEAEPLIVFPPPGGPLGKVMCPTPPGPAVVAPEPPAGVRCTCLRFPGSDPGCKAGHPAK